MFTDIVNTEGVGKNKAEAKKNAAAKALTSLKNTDLFVNASSAKQNQKIIASSIIATSNPIPTENVESNYVGQLQELCQKKGWPLPVYEVNGATGQSHQPTFYMICKVEHIGFTVTGNGAGRTKLIAKKQAAGDVLSQLRDRYSNENVSKFKKTY